VRIERGWPLLTVDTEVNGDSKSTHEGVLPWLDCWACRAGTRDNCPALAALVGPVPRKIFLAYTISTHLSLSPRKVGWQSCGVACLLVCFSEGEESAVFLLFFLFHAVIKD
jgi:hypothetical protein